MSVNGSSSPIVPGQLSQNYSPLWWTFKLATATAMPGNIQGFGDIRGANGITNEMTNMVKSFELAAPESFLLQTPRITYPGSTAADIRSMIINYVVRIIVAGKVMIEAPPDFFPGGGGVTSDPQNGIADPTAVVNLQNLNITISSGMTFKAELLGTSYATTGAFCMRIYFDGLYSRAIG